MILKEDSQTNPSKPRVIKPFIGVLLLVVSVFLSIITFPLGFPYGILKSFLFSKKRLGEYCLQIAISIDQTGNVVMQHLLNDLFITAKSRSLFGNADETISSVLGKNKKEKTLSPLGRFLANTLDALDKNHVTNSIDYSVK